jgi:tetratricopeptide (TPR) repeat protein
MIKKYEQIEKIFLLLLTLTIAAGCASSRLMVETDPPGADVFAFLPGQAPKKVGVAPYTISDTDVPDRNASVQIVVSKEGYLPNSVLLPPAMLGRAGKVNFKLEQQVLPKQCTSQTESLNKLGRAIAEAQSMIKSKQLDQAEKIMTEMIVEYPGISVVYDIIGNIQYLRRDFEKALSAYKKSRALAPDNAKTQRMIQQIESLRGGPKSESPQ